MKPTPTGWARRADLSAMVARAAALGAVLESVQAVMPPHLDGADLDPETDEIVDEKA